MTDVEEDIRSYVQGAFAAIPSVSERRIPTAQGGALDAIGRSAHTRSRRRILAGVFAACLVLALIGATFAIAQLGTKPSHRPASHPSPQTTIVGFTAEQIATWQWSDIPAAPIAARSNSAVAWTGKEMLIWGGATGMSVSQQLFADGAAYNASSQTWRTLPTAPLTARTRTASVWTGKKLFVWGGYVSPNDASNDGALYDPKTNLWQQLPQSPLDPRVDAHAIWTGHEVIVIGGQPATITDSNRAFIDAAAYDAATNSWHVLPAIPQPYGHDTQDTEAVWAGSQLLVWSLWSHAQETSPGTSQLTSGIDLHAYKPTANRWHKVPDAPGRPDGVFDPIWTGSDVIVPATQAYCGACSSPAPSGLRGSRYTPTTNTWRPMTHGPVDDTGGPALWTGSALIRLNTGAYIGDPQSPTVPGDSAIWNPTIDQWSALAKMPTPISEPAIAWTGKRLIIWGAVNAFSPTALPPIGMSLHPS